jgi:beta-1,2-mannobiose phosphorylase / 1,2-beta-oligomannan phosphorylase
MTRGMSQGSRSPARTDPRRDDLPLRKRLLLGPRDVSPSRADLEVIGVFNPGAAEVDDRVILLLRVAERPREKRPGFVALPRMAIEGELTVDWVPEHEVDFIDPRVVRLRETGRVRLTFVSHLLVARLIDGETPTVEFGPRFLACGPWEEFGVEDPRLTLIEGRYYFTYVAVSRHGAATALASTQDFRSFTRHGIIFPIENKDVVLFPERIAGNYLALHRPSGKTAFSTPEMWIARSNDLIHWGEHEPLVVGRSEWASGRIGGGVPPIRTDLGWLAIYHANRHPTRVGEVGAYAAAAMLLDADHPSRVIRQTAEPLFCPTETYECEGFVNDVVFPTGAVRHGDCVAIYYGASDMYTAVVEIGLQSVLSGLQSVPATSKGLRC